VHYIKIKNLTGRPIIFSCRKTIKPGITTLYLPHYSLYELERLNESKQIEILEFISEEKSDSQISISHDFSILSVIQRENCNEKIDLGIQLIGAPLAWQKTKGEGVGVLVIDTGVDASHIDLKNRIKFGISFVGRNPDDWNDALGHGTLVSGIVGAEDNGVGVIGVAPECNLLIAKVISNQGTGNPKAIKDAIEWAIQKKDELGIHILNMSLGSPSPCDIVKIALIKARKAGLIVVCASGNNGNGQLANYPGKYAEEGLCICIGAIDNNKTIAKFSNTGKDAISFAAPGVNIYSTYLNNTYATMSGTSFSAPIISGLCALIYSRHKADFENNPTPYTNLDMMIKYLRNFIKKEDNGFQDLKNNNFGWGIPQITENNIEMLHFRGEENTGTEETENNLSKEESINIENEPLN
jgi:subtilisin family serine protease